MVKQTLPHDTNARKSRCMSCRIFMQSFSGMLQSQSLYADGSVRRFISTDREWLWRQWSSITNLFSGSSFGTPSYLTTVHSKRLLANQKFCAPGNLELSRKIWISYVSSFCRASWKNNDEPALFTYAVLMPRQLRIWTPYCRETDFHLLSGDLWGT